jgi:hypothetical protein
MLKTVSSIGNAINAGYVIGQSAVPFVLTSGSMGNNGALTLTTAVATAYPNAYIYMPAGAISAGSAAGWYYAVFSTTTAATVYNNTYTSGSPTIPSSPAAFSTTGPGAFTFSTASEYVGISLPVPGGALDANGSLEIQYTATANNSANPKYARAYINNSALLSGATAFTTQGVGRFNCVFANRGVVNAQSTNCVQFANAQLSQVNSTSAINTSANMTVNSNLYLNASTSDTMTIETFRVVVYP